MYGKHFVLGNAFYLKQSFKPLKSNTSSAACLLFLGVNALIDQN